LQIISGLVVTVELPEAVEAVEVVEAVGVVECAVAVEAFEVVSVPERNLDNLRALPDNVVAGWNSAPK
jgi:hypothetical protein